MAPRCSWRNIYCTFFKDQMRTFLFCSKRFQASTHGGLKKLPFNSSTPTGSRKCTILVKQQHKRLPVHGLTFPQVFTGSHGLILVQIIRVQASRGQRPETGWILWFYTGIRRSIRIRNWLYWAPPWMSTDIFERIYARFHSLLLCDNLEKKSGAMRWCHKATPVTSRRFPSSPEWMFRLFYSL